MSKPYTTEELPFNDMTLVYKVHGKIFAIMALDTQDSITLKCIPLDALERRASYDSVQPGYHMNKQHWITVPLDSSIPAQLLYTWIDDSYSLVVAGLPVARKQEIVQALADLAQKSANSQEKI
ncbi:MAG: MmcQ/YjbR family DNA-binding protein [Bacteroidota bacterium]|nr:MmcQ/YjbR family DNA-binding protein [Bacteroidota bacterium]